MLLGPVHGPPPACPSRDREALAHSPDAWREWLRMMNPAAAPLELVAANAMRAAIPESLWSSL